MQLSSGQMKDSSENLSSVFFPNNSRPDLPGACGRSALGERPQWALMMAAVPTEELARQQALLWVRSVGISPRRPRVPFTPGKGEPRVFGPELGVERKHQVPGILPHRPSQSPSTLRHSSRGSGEGREAQSALPPGPRDRKCVPNKAV